jgi:predicted alpha/beta superfamily hydrolase
MKHIFIVLSLLLSLSAFAQFQPPEIITIDSKYFNDKREIKVFLPAGYSSSPDRTYKVVYLFDAQNSIFVDFLVATSNYLSSLSTTFVSPYILVGIKTKNRQFEFLPKNKTEQPYKDYSPKVKLGGADTLIAHLREEVLPEINKRYRTNNYNIAIGHSLGATFSIYSLIHAPEIFKAVIAISPNLYYDHEQVLNELKAQKNFQQLQNKFLYVAYAKDGTLESRFYPASEKLRSFLKKNRLPGFYCKVEFLPNNDHSTTPLAGIYRGLTELNKQLIITENVDGFYANAGPQFVDHLKAYYAGQSKKFGLKLPTAEDINHLSYNLYYSGKADNAVKVASWAVELYPADVNLFDSLGELLQNSGKKEEARTAFQKGLEVVEQQKNLVDSAAYNSLKNALLKRLQRLDSK